ncbi:class I SAM-dependent methyltransferase [Ensifer sp. SL37]|uniref:class I SAM-dependent methyltransferase n=1 Tax=Ensifer sp. SL37 TaxID=2995137 RepID=UPI002275E7E3|nr:methyltransferase domain-containing protein [Ensifer sp. SL37]MCY1740990.1 methyltransferase domain-containing protein [Ensifer sp. SL37]
MIAVSYILELLRTEQKQVVADIGCFGWNLAAICAQQQHSYLGIDRQEPPGRPEFATFGTMENHRLHVADDVADFTIASHVIEHLSDPVNFAMELARITKPGGRLLIEAPSEFSAFDASTRDVEDHSFDCFWDDPTHVRPYTPGALYRLAISVGAVPEVICRGLAGTIPVSFLQARVPFSGSIGSRYVSFKDVKPGLMNAYQAIWPERSIAQADEERFRQRSRAVAGMRTATRTEH